MKTSYVDWIDSGTELLRAGRFDALTIEGLCTKLHRTKGAFYHHFESADAFKTALIAAWEETHMQLPMRLAERNSGQSRRRALYRSIAAVDEHLERSMRVWASMDTTARAACARVDKQRCDYLAQLFIEEKMSHTEARRRAEREYVTLLGRLFFYAKRP